MIEEKLESRRNSEIKFYAEPGLYQILVIANAEELSGKSFISIYIYSRTMANGLTVGFQFIG